MLARILLVLFALAGVAFAQAPVIVDPVLLLDPRSWFTDVAALAGVVFALTALVKGRFSLHDVATLAVSYVAGVAIAVGFSFTSLFPVDVSTAVVYGLTAATFASGGREGLLVVLQKAFSWLSPLMPPQPVVGEGGVAVSETPSTLPPSRKG